MSSFQELVGELHSEVGAAGVAPTTVVSQTGEAKRLVNWIKRADEYIQLLWVNWKFLRAEFTSGNVTADGVATLAVPSNLNFWDFDTFRITYPGETQQHPLEAVEYNKIKRDILDTTTNIPSRVIVMPDNSLKFEPVPDGAYTITADYFKKPTLLAANSDVSAIPPAYHSIILGRAMILYANYENAPEIKDQGKEIYTEQLARMENHELPNEQNARFTSGGHFEVVAE